MHRKEQSRISEVVVLAGGMGTRLKPITESIPKPLVVVGGRPFIEHQLEMLAGHGFERALFLTGYLGDRVAQVLGSGDRFGMTFCFSKEPAPLGTGGALRRARELLPEEFVLVYGDSYLNIDYQAAFRTFAQGRLAGPFGLMVVGPVTEEGEVGNVCLDEGGRFVSSYRKGLGGNHTLIDAGVQIFSREVTALIPEGEYCALEEKVFPTLAAQGRLLSFKSDRPCYDIGTPERLALFEQALGNSQL